jgi:hypothetical protein
MLLAGKRGVGRKSQRNQRQRRKDVMAGDDE